MKLPPVLLAGVLPAKGENMPRTRSLLITIAAMLVCASVANAQNWDEYPQFRHVSGLPGNGFSVTPDGNIEFGGAQHINVPCAYTPTTGNYSLLYASASNDKDPHLGFEGDEINGSAHLGVGFGEPEHGLFASYFVVDVEMVNTVNLQYQLQGQTLQDPAIAVGVIDIFDQRMKRVNTRGGAQSFYVTATKRVSESYEKPFYLTVGVGNARFSGVFGAGSWYPHPRLNLGFEYDGRVSTPHVSYRVYNKKDTQSNVFMSWSNFDRPVIGFHISHSR